MLLAHPYKEDSKVPSTHSVVLFLIAINNTSSAKSRLCSIRPDNVFYISDIYGMLLFVGVDPFYDKVWWTKLLYGPLLDGDNKPLFELLSLIMWRTEKKDVLDQVIYKLFSYLLLEIWSDCSVLQINLLNFLPFSLFAS